MHANMRAMSAAAILYIIIMTAPYESYPPSRDHHCYTIYITLFH